MPNSGLDTELLTLARGGDVDAADRLLGHNRDRLKRMVCARMDTRLAARIDPSDVVQEALMEASRRLPAFLEKDDDMFYPWLRAIAWERLVQLNRKHLGARKRSVHREIDLPLPDASSNEVSRRLVASIPTASAVAVRKELQHRVRSHLESLQKKDQEILLLRHLEQLPMKEVAAIIGVSLGAAQSRYCRAIERLHSLIGNESHI
jgi:RNA polymerase sigma-70 factor (ECF subfamily)